MYGGGQTGATGMPSGQSGLGKSTMVNTLFKSKVSRKASQPGQEEHIPKTVQLQSVTHGKVNTTGLCPTCLQPQTSPSPLLPPDALFPLTHISAP